MTFVSLYSGAGADIYKPELWAMETLRIFFENVGIRGKVHRDFSQEIAEHGDTVNTRIPEIMTAMDVGSEDEIKSEGDILEPFSENVVVVLNKNQHVTFKIRDKLKTISFKNLIAEYMEPAALGLVRAIEQDGIAVMSHVTTGFDNAAAHQIEPVTSPGGYTPAIYKLDYVAQIARELDQAFVPIGDRFHIVTPKALYDMTVGSDSNVALMLDASKVGGESFLRERRLGRLFGVDVEMQQSLATVADAGSLVYPDLAVDVNPFWWRNSVAYVSRNLESVDQALGVQMVSMSERDESIRVSLQYDLMKKRSEISLDKLWGWKVMRQNAGGVVKTAQ